MRRLLFVFLLLPFLLAARADTFLILPFSNLSRSPDLDWIGESIAETVRELLVSDGILVLERDDRTEAYRRLSVRNSARLTKATVIKIGETLDAARVMYGEFEFHPVIGALNDSRGSLRLSARVIDLQQMKAGPEFIEMGALEDLAALESELARQALRYLAPKSASSEADFRRQQSPIRVDAMESYIRGLLAADDEPKVRLFTKAAHLDANFAQPCFQLGRYYWLKKDYGAALEWLAKVKPGDPRFHHATFLLGICRYRAADYAGAQAAFRLVADAVPLNEVFNNLGAAQLRRNLPDAVESFRKALAGDEADPVYHFNLGYALWRQHDFAAAADRFRATLDRKPDDAIATYMLGRCLQRSGLRPGEAPVDNLERLKENYEETAYRQLKAALEPASKLK